MTAVQSRFNKTVENTSNVVHRTPPTPIKTPVPIENEQSFQSSVYRYWEVHVPHLQTDIRFFVSHITDFSFTEKIDKKHILSHFTYVHNTTTSRDNQQL